MKERKLAPATDPIELQIAKNLQVGPKWEASWNNKYAREPYPGWTREQWESGWDRIFGGDNDQPIHR